MQILQQLQDLLPSLNNFVSMLEMHSITFLLLSVSCIITISTFLCRILRRLTSLCAVCLTKVKKLLSKQPQPQLKAQQQMDKLQKELLQLQMELKSGDKEVKSSEQSSIFQIRR